MNNLFRITQSNLDILLSNDFTLKKPNKNSKIEKLNNNKLFASKIDKINNQTNTSTQNINFNCEIANKIDNNNNLNNINTQNYDNNILRFYKTEQNINIFEKNNIIQNNFNNNVVIKNKNKNEDKNDNKRVVWEFGKSGIKVDRLKKYMGRNLAILFYLNNIFIDFVDYHQGIDLSTMIDKFKVFKDNSNELNGSKCLYWNNFGSIILKSNDLYVKIDKHKISGIYEILDCGFLKFYDVDFTDEFLKKNKIPDFNSILLHPDNIKHFSKIIKLLTYGKNFKTKSNFINNIDFTDILKFFLPNIIEKINNKQDLFDSNNNFTFYIKIYDTHTKAFLIDKNSKLIYYLMSVENSSKLNGYLFIYILQLDSKYRILNIKKNYEKNNNKQDLELDLNLEQELEQKLEQKLEQELVQDLEQDLKLELEQELVQDLELNLELKQKLEQELEQELIQDLELDNKQDLEQKFELKQDLKI